MPKLHHKRPWGVPHSRNALASGLLINSIAATVESTLKIMN